MEKSTRFWLILIFLLVLGLRIAISFQTQELNYDAYSVLRQVEHIRDTGAPMFEDDLSYGGRTLIFSPLYHYLLAFFSLFIPAVLVLKIVPNILVSLLVLVVFYLSYSSVKNERIALLTAAFSGFVPVLFSSTINNASIYSAVIPLFFLVIYYFLQTNRDPKFLVKLLVSMVVLTLIHPASLILAASLLVYLLLLKVQQFRESSREPEVVLFFLFLVFWLNMIIYKKALAMHGGAIVWQNIPSQIIVLSYSQITFLQSIYAIGIVPLIFGLASIYMSLFNSKRKTVTMMMSVCIVIFILLWFKFIELSLGLIFLGVALTVLSSHSLLNTYEAMAKFKLKSAQLFFMLGIIIVLVVTFLPNISFSIYQAKVVPSEDDISAFVWIKNNTPDDSVVLVMPDEGSAMSYFSNRKNVMDENYLLINSIDSRYDDVSTLYDARFITTALETLNYYSVDYVVLSEKTGFEKNMSRLGFESDCVSRVYFSDENSNDVVGNDVVGDDVDLLPGVFKVNCVLRQR